MQEVKVQAETLAYAKSLYWERTQEIKKKQENIILIEIKGVKKTW